MQQQYDFDMSCLYKQSLLEDTPKEEVEEMESAVKSSLMVKERASWQVLKAGGGARG